MRPQALFVSFLFGSGALFVACGPAKTAATTNPNAVAQSALQECSRRSLDDSYGRLPIQFEQNVGQSDSRVKYLSRTGNTTLFLTRDDAVLCLTRHVCEPPMSSTMNSRGTSQRENGSAVTSVLRVRALGANPKTAISAADELPGKVNYLLGKHPGNWHANVRTFAKVTYAGMYKGIDLVYHGNTEGTLEYDFVVRPGGDPRSIALTFSGAASTRVAHNGDLILGIYGGEVTWRKPIVYQEDAHGNRTLIAGNYVVGDGDVRFRVARYDCAHPLVIDPALIYSSFLGGKTGGGGWANGIAIDGSGDAYATGLSYCDDFPTTPLAYQKTNNAFNNSRFNVTVTKFNPTGSALIYSTYLGGTGGDAGTSIAVDRFGDAYVGGYTVSSNFPTVGKPFQPTLKGSENAFVAELNPAGSGLVYSTYIGGSRVDYICNIKVDGSGSAYVTGCTTSGDFPVAGSPFQPTSKSYPRGATAFVTKLDPTGTELVYSTFLGGSSWGWTESVAIDDDGYAYVTGFTSSSDFPTAGVPFQKLLKGSENAFVTKINPTGSELVYSTYLGGSGSNAGGDEGNSITLDANKDAYVTGLTYSKDFPTAGSPFQKALKGSENAFMSKLDPSGSHLVYSTYLGGSGDASGHGDVSNAVVVDGSGNAYVTGSTGSSDFPIAGSPYQGTLKGTTNAFVSEFNPTGSSLLYSTFFGGSGSDVAHAMAIDSFENAYVAGYTNSGNFPTAGSPKPYQTSLTGGQDAFVAKFDLAPVPKPVLSSISPTAGPLAGGTTVTVKGTQFTPAASVTFGGTAAKSVTYSSVTSLIAVSPARAAGTVDVLVKTAGGTSAVSAADKFTYEQVR